MGRRLRRAAVALDGLPALLLTPLDLAGGIVAGIAGARGEALLAAPLYVEDGDASVVTVAGDGLGEEHLHRLVGLAGEAAPALTLAMALRRLTG